MIDLVEDTTIPIAIVSLLSALPNTQLSRRLEKEGRRLPFEEIATYEDRRGDFMTSGLNFVTKRPRREVLVDYRNIIERLFTPEAYFGRVRRLAPKLWPCGRPWRVHRRKIRRELLHMVRLALHITLHRPDMRREFWKTVAYTLKHRAAALPSSVIQSVLYIHFGPHARFVIDRIDAQIAAIDDGSWAPELLVDVPEKLVA